MGSILKGQKLSEQPYEDRISNLPNSLIAQILSCLPTKHAVATSVLSTRWKQLWTSITSFDIDDKLLLCPQNKSTDPSLQRSFTSFVRRVLLHHVSCVQRFRLKCSQSYDASLVNGWIADTLLRNVRELDLAFSILDHSTMLPQDLFTCRTLVVLKLNADGDMNIVPTSVSLPSLRILHLGCYRFVDDDSINRFLFGCPVLEELSMSGRVGGNVSVINIVAPMLTSLFIHDCSFGDIRPGFEHKIVLDTPALLYLEIRDHAEDGCYLVENLHHLIRADISLYADDGSAISKALCELLKGMSNAQFLKLDFSTEVTCMCDFQLPKFPNMTCLELGEIFNVKWEFLLELLENSPRLETLVFKEGLGYDCEVFTQLLWNPARNVPSCLLSHLKVIGISDFGSGKEEWQMVDYFLQNAKVLEKVNIDYGYGGSKWTIHASRTCDVAAL
ncbi:F-box protein At4g22280-like isoform X2 [Rhododendron vialii]|uniref:F-box protein At4g22280-like isoform X2 n=1 Tax=Rhododendron vialii TaxID=182163 RepID=UPI00265F6ABF|nr:F-box protein At4g22280-like isoform X2 [Rhododendron vialii]XP_058179463.1 F-box protein At4g22280-like isoform X2 [Rhododendron vialii]